MFARWLLAEIVYISLGRSWSEFLKQCAVLTRIRENKDVKCLELLAHRGKSICRLAFCVCEKFFFYT